MYSNRLIRSPKPWDLGRPLSHIGSACSVAVKPSMANTMDKLCWSSQEPDFSPSSTSPPPAVHHLSGKLLLQCLQSTLDKEQIHEKLASLASQLGAGASGDCGDLIHNISCLVTESVKKRQLAEKRAKVIEDKHLDSIMKIQVLEMELAEARHQRDSALKNLQDLTWQPTLVSPSTDALDVSCYTDCYTPETTPFPPTTPETAPFPPTTPETAPFPPTTPETAPFPPTTPETALFPPTTPETAPFSPTTPETTPFPATTPETAPFPATTPETAPFPPTTPETAPFPPTTPETAPFPATTPETAPFPATTPETAPFPPTTPDTAPIDTLPIPLVPQSPSQGAVNGTPPTALISAQASVVRHTPSLNSRSPSVRRTVGATGTSSSTAALPSSYILGGMADLKSFHQGGGDVILGSGANGTVHLFRHRVTDVPIAVKTFDLPNNIQEMTRKVTNIQAEASCLEILGKDEYFPTFLGCLEINSGTIGLAMEFIGDTTTGESFTLSRGIRDLALSQHDFLRLARDIAKALRRIHEMGYLMNDLKGDNCLLRKTQTGRWQAVIVDFGLACSLASPFSFGFSDEDKKKYQNREVYAHIAPECALDDQNTSVSSDVFQLGRLFVLMGVAANNADLTAIGNLCRLNISINRPSIDELVNELERVM